MKEKINRFFEIIIMSVIIMFVVGCLLAAVLCVLHAMTCIAGYCNLVDSTTLRAWFRYVLSGYLMVFLGNILVLLVLGIPWYIFTCGESDGMCLVKTKTTKKTTIK